MRRFVGLIPQDNNLERELSVEEALLVYGRLFGLKRVKDTVAKTMERFSLMDIRHKQVRTLSGDDAPGPHRPYAAGWSRADFA